MADQSIWRSRPVFITSTFRDMHAERDHLHRFVFPQIDERLKERFYHLEPIDLRWGVETVSVSEQQKKEILVLKVCLAEIERSRPFLIGLLGDRYGWIPPAERAEAAAREMGHSGDISRRSVTALEIDYGVLNHQRGRNRCRFYFRDPLPYDEMDPETASVYSDRHSGEAGAEEAGERLRLLKARIEREVPGRVRHYSAKWDGKLKRVTGLEEWGRLVLEDLWHDLEEETRSSLHKPLTTWQEEEDWVLEQFVEDKSRDFIGREAIMKELHEFALHGRADGCWAISVTGPAGAGKSSLFARLLRELRNQDVQVLAHAAGISNRSVHVDILLRSWLSQLAGPLRERNPAEEVTERDELETLFAGMLNRAAGKKRVVCLIDSLNQFERTPTARRLTYLPRSWPGNACLITTSIPGEETESLERLKGTRRFDLPVLNESEMDGIVEAIGRRHHKAIPPEIRRLLLTRKGTGGELSSGIPLWIELALEELMLLDADDFQRAEEDFSGTAEERLHSLIRRTAEDFPGDVEGLYAHLLNRISKVHGIRIVKVFASVLALSRSGWRETDLRLLLPAISKEPWDALRFASLRRSFRAHLAPRGALMQWDFSHAQMREAVAKAYLGAPAGIRNWLHSAMANHLQGLSPADPLRRAELMHHIIGSNDLPRAARYYASEMDDAELAGATRALADHIVNAGNDLTFATSMLQVEGLKNQEALVLSERIASDLPAALENDLPVAGRLRLVHAAGTKMFKLHSASPSEPLYVMDLATFSGRIGDLCLKLGATDDADKCYRRMKEFAEKSSSMQPDNRFALGNLAVAYQRRGGFATRSGNTQEALANYRKAMEILETLHAADPANSDFSHNLAVNCDAMGDLSAAIGELENGRKLYDAAGHLWEELCGKYPMNTAYLDGLAGYHHRIGNLLVRLGDMPAASGHFTWNLRKMQKAHRDNPEDARLAFGLARAYYMVGDVFARMQQPSKAQEYYAPALSILMDLHRSNPDDAKIAADLAVGYHKEGEVYDLARDLPRAAESYSRSLELATELRSKDPRNAELAARTALTHHCLGHIRIRQFNFTGGMEQYEKAVGIMQDLHANDPDNGEFALQLSSFLNFLGDIQLILGVHPAAVDNCEGSLKILEELMERHPRNPEIKKSLAAAYRKVGDARTKAGDEERGTYCYRKAHQLATGAE